MLSLVSLLFFVFGGTALISHIASTNGRNGALWALLSLAASGLLFMLARALLDAQLADDGMDINLGYALLLVMAPVGGHILVGTIVAKLPFPTMAVPENAWQMAWLGGSEREANTRCRVFITNEHFAVEPELGSVTPDMQIPLSSLVAQGDGEAVRISWNGGDVHELFKPVDTPQNREAAVRRAQAIAARISLHASSATLEQARP